EEDAAPQMDERHQVPQGHGREPPGAVHPLHEHGLVRDEQDAPHEERHPQVDPDQIEPESPSLRERGAPFPGSPSHEPLAPPREVPPRRRRHFAAPPYRCRRPSTEVTDLRGRRTPAAPAELGSSPPAPRVDVRVTPFIHCSTRLTGTRSSTCVAPRDRKS